MEPNAGLILSLRNALVQRRQSEIKSVYRGGREAVGQKVKSYSVCLLSFNVSEVRVRWGNMSLHAGAHSMKLVI